MNGINRVTLFGNIGQAPEYKPLPNGNGVLKLRMATTESFFNKTTNAREEKTEWHNVTVWGKRGEALEKILTKGMGILVEGGLHTSSYEKGGERRYSTEVVATNVCIASSKDARGESPVANDSAPIDAPAATPVRSTQVVDYNDLPF